jgi:uncharacterized protein (TIGR03435 family)
MTAVIESASSLVASLGPSIVVKATVTLAVTRLAVRLARRSRAAVRHLWLMAGIVALLVLPFAPRLVPSVRVAVAPAPLAAAESPALSRDPVDEAVGDAAWSETSAIAPAPRWSPTPAGMLTMVWMAGAVVFVLPLAVGLLQVRRLLRGGHPWPEGQQRVKQLARAAGVRRRIDVVLHDGIGAPAACGIFRHAILFPTDARGWPDDDLERAAVHEVEHVRRSDCLVSTVGRLICAVYWFHPLVWVAWRRLGLEAERACDDAVVRRGDEAIYADQLVRLASRMAPALRQPLLTMASRSQLARRVAALLDERQARGRAGRTTGTAILLVTATVIMALSSFELVRAAPEFALDVVSVPESDGRAFTVTLVHPAVPPALPVMEAQATRERETFDVASIRENRSGSMRRFGPHPSGLSSTSVTVLDLIWYVFRVDRRDVVGDLPNWIGTTRFDVTARTADGPLTPARARAMTRALLEDRFGLDASFEPATGPVYALVSARSDGGTGPNLRRSESTCRADEPLSPPLEGPQRTLDFSGYCGLASSSSSGVLTGVFGNRVTMREFAEFLSLMGGLDRPVVDRTGLTGEFDFHVGPTRDMVAATGEARFLMALREQLGLMLRAEQGSFEVLRIRRIEQPSPD